MWSTSTPSYRSRMSTLDEITKEKQRVSEALARVGAQRENLASQFAELEATERVLARYSKGSGARKMASAKARPTATNAASATRRAYAQCHHETSWWQPKLAEPQRPGPRPGNRQDAARNRRCMRGGSPEPCRCRDCPAQAGRPYRRAGRKALRHAVDASGTERRGLRIEKERGVSGLRWPVLKGVG
jgi:hypothetical protein